jgi:hypothetical protein
MKCEAVVNIIAPICNEDLHVELNRSDFMCITVDASNKNDIKIVPVIVCYFIPQADVKMWHSSIYGNNINK